MRFRVAAIQDAGTPPGLDDARLHLEDWLNQQLGRIDFGCSEGCIMLVIIVASVLPKEPKRSRLISDRENGSTLALHLTVEPESVRSADDDAAYAKLLGSAIVRALPPKPLRKPRGLDYARLREALVMSINQYASSAA